ncbi:MAG: tetratricopeptide repeat protein [candidate division WOR-3 bacterium]|nr:tetratricopeptide repeat protein [candidate division WOR-3 bacterium]
MRKIFLLIFLFSFCFKPAIVGGQTKPYDVLIRSGKIYLQNRQYEKAKEMFQEAVSQRPEDPEGNFHLAITLISLGDYLNAAKYLLIPINNENYLKKIQKDENYKLTCWSSLIEVSQNYLINNELDSALIYAKGALILDPERPFNYTLLSQIYVNLKMYDSLYALAQNMISKDVNSPQGYSLLGSYYLVKEDYDNALIAFENSIKNYERKIEEEKNKLAELLKLKEEKERIIKKLLNYHSEKKIKEFENYLKDSLKFRSGIEKVAQLVLEISSLNQEYTQNLLRVGLIQMQKKKEKEALNTFKKLFEIDEKNYDALFYLGVNYYNLSLYDSCRITFEKLLSLIIRQPTEEEKIKIKELITDTSSNYVELPSQFLPYLYYLIKDNSFSIFTPERLENVYMILGGAYAQLAKLESKPTYYDLAIKSFEKILLINPKNLDAYQNLAVVYRDKGDKETARKYLEKKMKLEKEKK